MSYANPLHGLDSAGEPEVDRLEIRRRTPEGRAAYLEAKRAEIAATGEADKLTAFDAFRSVMDGEIASDYLARVEAAVLSDATLCLVAAEALRAHQKHVDKGGSILDPTMSTERRLAALGEEHGEVCRALTYDGDQGKDHLIKELVQTASVALTWVEYLRRLP